MNFFAGTFPYSPYQFSLWRILFGSFLTFYSARTLPYVTELYSDSGIFTIAPQQLFFGNLFALSRSPELVLAASIVMFFAAICITVGYYRRIAALVYWYLMISLFNLNPLTEDPSQPYIGLLLILLVLIPTGEPLSVGRKLSPSHTWRMPTPAYFIALLALGVGYSLSGLDKLNAPGFWSGDALFFILHSAIVFDSWLRELLLALPTFILQFISWFIAWSMLFTLPLLLWWRTRSYIWLTLFLMFVGVLIIFDLAQVALGMLLFKLFLFDARCVPPKASPTGTTLYYDTTCNLCHAYVGFSESEDKEGQLSYQSIYKRRDGDGDPQSIILNTDGKELLKSDAVLMHWSQLGGWWRLIAVIAAFVPHALRDGAYDYVAHRRYRWFGRYGQSATENKKLKP